MDRRAAVRRGGFTLIELLVVVAIIGLLISILLPSLRTAREQARTVKCVSNLKQIGGAMHMYFHEHRDWFPYEREPFPDGWVVTAFYYGGHPGRRGANTLFDNPNLRYTFAEKPFNRYFFSNLRTTRETNGETNTAAFEEARKPFEMFYCPSDTGGMYNTSQQIDPENIIPTHHHQGASYDINYHYVWLWAAGRSLGGIRPRAFTRSNGAQYLWTANKFLNHQRAKWASSFVMLYEDPFDSAQYTRLAKVGWHRQWNRHSFLFLDGHAANVHADPSVDGTRGIGWKTSSWEWYNDPQDPDYELRNIRP